LPSGSQSFHRLWPPSPFKCLIINIVTLGFCNITAELFSESICSWPPELVRVPHGGSRALVEKPWSGVYFCKSQFEGLRLVLLWKAVSLIVKPVIRLG